MTRKNRTYRHKKKATAKRRFNEIGANTTVYSAAAWWRDSDPSMQVIGLDESVVKKELGKLIDEEAERAYDDELYDSVDDAADAIAWSGVHAMRLGDIVSSRNMKEAVRDLRSQGYHYPKMP